MLSEATFAVVMEALEFKKQDQFMGGPTPGELKAINAALAELQAAQAAGEWRPVNERFLLTHDTGLLDHPKLFVRWNADDESILVGKDDGSFYHCPLPDDIRLCQRIGSQEGRDE